MTDRTFACDQRLGTTSAPRDLVGSRARSGRVGHTLNLIDEFKSEYLAIPISRKPNPTDVIDMLTDQLIPRGMFSYVSSDNGPKFIDKWVRGWIAVVDAGLRSSSPDRLRKPAPGFEDRPVASYVNRSDRAPHALRL